MSRQQMFPRFLPGTGYVHLRPGGVWGGGGGVMSHRSAFPHHSSWQCRLHSLLEFSAPREKWHSSFQSEPSLKRVMKPFPACFIAMPFPPLHLLRSTLVPVYSLIPAGTHFSDPGSTIRPGRSSHPLCHVNTLFFSLDFTSSCLRASCLWRFTDVFQAAAVIVLQATTKTPRQAL